MAKGKSIYTFNIENPAMADNMIKQFLNANGFKYVTKNGLAAYQMADGIWTGKKFFEYYFNGNTLTIYAYVYKLHKPVLLDEEYYLCIPKNELKTVLYPLLGQLEQLQNSGTQNNNTHTDNNQLQPNNMPNNMQSNNQFQQNNMPNNQYQNYGTNYYVPENKHYKTLAIISFVLSILGLLLTCLGRSVGLYILFIIFFTAYYGLKSKLKGLAIAAIVIGIIDALIFLLAVVLNIGTKL